MWLVWVVIIQQAVISEKSINGRDLNPELLMNISEIIQYWGYPSEEHEIMTSDGYYLKANRIPNGIRSSEKTDAGYDVWIINNRGTTWSRRHQNLTIDQEEFWDFSFDEMARYDLPAMISFIVKKTRNSKIHLVGYSQGATQGLIALSSVPYVAEKIKMFHALSPATIVKNSQTPIIKLLFLPDAVLKGLLGRRDFFLRNEISREIVIRTCSSIIYNKLCSRIISFFGGYNEKNLNLSRMDVYMSYFPDSTSVQNILHWGQSQIISHHGYPSEEYEVLTEDGYYLTINRIPWGRKNISVIDPTEPKRVVFLQHGILGEASHWVQNMANNSLGFIFADAGYDVWLGNSRGTSMSQRHQTFSVDQVEFWNFSFHEMAMYDLPATINFILKKTKQKQLYYVGYSQGATIGFIAFSAMPELSKKIRMFLALAPVIYATYVPNNLLKSLSSFPQYSFKQIFGDKNTQNPIKHFMKKLCTIAFMHKLCAKFIFFPDTYNTTNLNMSRIDVYAAHFPDITSVKTILHWKQILDTGLFRYFDYEDKNQMIYKQSSPPSYQIKDLSVPTAVWSGGQDTVADPKDIELLLSGIVNLVYHCSWADWTHWDLIWGLNAPQRMFFKIIQLMEKSV
ncbi:lysosomal acid lipase/cholesteryl ester hydrolase-like [Pseudonaja textilis]|uniref:lysosomal acid lipase/cholesteryl ester hydrolase-like n=1 Tax=Pseudonaja textilis TaxID=8673 RepID=UPI000EA83F7A|nr:lysosomal acid lipase/cholesteryl ester hydrolase-like [Pseudonaja textilis]